MSQILDEMLNNRISTAANIDRLRRSVVQSLERLRKKTMADHARDLDLFSRIASASTVAGDEGEAIHRGFERVLAVMRSVLAKLQKAETFTEIIERMRVILKLQKEARESTRRKHEEALREIFGPDDGDEKKDKL